VAYALRACAIHSSNDKSVNEWTGVWPRWARCSLTVGIRFFQTVSPIGVMAHRPRANATATRPAHDALALEGPADPGASGRRSHRRRSPRTTAAHGSPRPRPAVPGESWTCSSSLAQAAGEPCSRYGVRAGRGSSDTSRTRASPYRSASSFIVTVRLSSALPPPMRACFQASAASWTGSASRPGKASLVTIAASRSLSSRICLRARVRSQAARPTPGRSPASSATPPARRAPAVADYVATRTSWPPAASQSLACAALRSGMDVRI
jgi:hypothetical protein